MGGVWMGLYRRGRCRRQTLSDRPRLPMHVDKTLPIAERDTSSCLMYLGWLTFIRD